MPHDDRLGVLFTGVQVCLTTPRSVWQLTRVGGLHRILACNCTVCGKRSVFDFEVIFYVDRHSLVRISQVHRLESLSVRHIYALSICFYFY